MTNGKLNILATSSASHAANCHMMETVNGLDRLECSEKVREACSILVSHMFERIEEVKGAEERGAEER